MLNASSGALNPLNSVDTAVAVEKVVKGAGPVFLGPNMLELGQATASKMLDPSGGAPNGTYLCAGEAKAISSLFRNAGAANEGGALNAGGAGGSNVSGALNAAGGVGGSNVGGALNAGIASTAGGAPNVGGGALNVGNVLVAVGSSGASNLNTSS